MMHPPYSLNLAQSDYHLFHTLQKSLNGVKLTSKEAWERFWLSFSLRNPKDVNSSNDKSLSIILAAYLVNKIHLKEKYVCILMKKQHKLFCFIH